MANLTERQRIRIRSRIQKALLLLAAAAILAGIGIGIGYAVRSHRDRNTESAAESAEFVPPTAIPTATPEPTPEPYADRPEIDPADWRLQLVNYTHPLADGFVPEQLMDIESGERFDARAGQHLQKLIEDARAAGYTVYVCSGYRSYETQYYIYWNHIDQYEAEGMTYEEADAQTRLAVNYPGCSEHQLGLAADILEYQGQDMLPYIGGSGLMLWLEEHCMDYGFIIRYPDGKTDITGVEYEPWHLRFVGTCARYIMDHDLCLEEFLALYE